MPRPPRKRTICGGLREGMFKPVGFRTRELARVTLTLDGLEALRLADLEGLYQEEAAHKMGVSRATFARVLIEARRAVADALVMNKALEINGGPVEHCPNCEMPCPTGPFVRGSTTPATGGCPMAEQASQTPQ